MARDIHDIIKDFQKLWTVNLNGNYRENYKLNSLAKEISQSSFDGKRFSSEEQVAIQQAKLLYTISKKNKKH